MAIQFDEDRSRATASRTVQVGTITRLFVQMGLAKTAAGARVPMVIFLLLVLALTAYVLIRPTMRAPTITDQRQAELDLEFERETYGTQR